MKRVMNFELKSNSNNPILTIIAPEFGRPFINNQPVKRARFDVIIKVQFGNIASENFGKHWNDFLDLLLLMPMFEKFN